MTASIFFPIDVKYRRIHRDINQKIPLELLTIMEIPPGFIFLTQIAPRVLLLPGVAFWASGLVLGHAIPQWLQISACFLAPHAVVYLKGVVVQYHHQQQAKSRGSVLPPMARNRWPAGIDRLVEFLDNFRHGYMGLWLFLPASRWMFIR